MGAWGVGVFQDDVACDVRDEYDAARDEGLNQWAASQKVHADQADYFGDTDDGPVAVLALALEQVRRDRRCLQPDAEAALRAVMMLASEERMETWEEEDRGRRRAALSAARLKLERAQLVDPEAVRDEVAKPRKRRAPRFQVGDIVAFPLGVRALLGFARVLRIDEKVSKSMLLQVYRFISEMPPTVESLRSAGLLVTFNIFDDGIGRSPDRRIIGHHPVKTTDLPTRWYIHDNGWYFVPGPFSTPNQRQETTEADVRWTGAADASMLIGGILERTDQVCREFARVGLLSADDAAVVSRRHREFYERYRALPSVVARIQAMKEYRESFMEGVRPWH